MQCTQPTRNLLSFSFSFSSAQAPIPSFSSCFLSLSNINPFLPSGHTLHGHTWTYLPTFLCRIIDLLTHLFIETAYISRHIVFSRILILLCHEYWWHPRCAPIQLSLISISARGPWVLRACVLHTLTTYVYTQQDSVPDTIICFHFSFYTCSGLSNLFITPQI
ncbi:hypothetical protein B0H34DRAFT_254377 [Crassisporium funariophilum]|nr:hypothetical protein B0H34DRAFT_254377 [Crassisporium funariophilum]